MYDPYLGWKPKPNTRWPEGFSAYNSLCIRADPDAPVEYSLSPQNEMLRIVIIGDSFTDGDDVPFKDTWGYFLEKKLAEDGIKAEVLNLGVGSYGMDQAFLRWQRLGRDLNPDIVIMGLQMENTQRNVNLLKPVLQVNTGLSFSKARYILREDGLELINSPTLPPAKIPGILENMENWDLKTHEQFWVPENFQDRIWLKSKLIALVMEVFSPVEIDPFFYDISKEPARLTLRIIKKFKKEIKACQSCFLTVHMPITIDFIYAYLNREPVCSDMLAEIETDTEVIRTQDALLEEARQSSFFSLFMPHGHYSARGNEVIAKTIAQHISGNLRPNVSSLIK